MFNRSSFNWKAPLHLSIFSVSFMLQCLNTSQMRCLLMYCQGIKDLRSWSRSLFSWLWTFRDHFKKWSWSFQFVLPSITIILLYRYSQALICWEVLWVSPYGFLLLIMNVKQQWAKSVLGWLGDRVGDRVGKMTCPWFPLTSVFLFFPFFSYFQWQNVQPRTIAIQSSNAEEKYLYFTIQDLVPNVLL